VGHICCGKPVSEVRMKNRKKNDLRLKQITRRGGRISQQGRRLEAQLPSRLERRADFFKIALLRYNSLNS
jgi:hypothetical protein